ncbi:low temperature requirement protein A [Micromonospora musae]|uniref:low temperature requirement protein A n=1 Tax=Micromonospora musae TaxID=1894970 RepID=UPI003420970E
MAGKAAALLRPENDPQESTFLELLYDVVFVLALTTLSIVLGENLTWLGALHTLILLLPLSVVWATVAAVCNRFDPRRLPIQILVLASMLGTLVMAAAAPEAFHDRGLYFAGAYVAIQVGSNVVVVLLMRGHEVQQIQLRRLFWFSLSAVPWIAGGFVDDWARVALWLLAITVDYTAGALRLPTPWLGRAKSAEFELSGEHLAGRYRQFFIIALGELILVTGLTLDSSGFQAGQLMTVGAAFVTTALLWRIYVYRAGQLMAQSMAPAPKPIRARPVVYTHIVLVAAIIIIAMSYKLVIGHPVGQTHRLLAAVILGGPALFLVGRALLEYVVFHHVAPIYLIGVLVLGAISPAMILMPPLGAAIAAVAVLAGVAVADTTHGRRPPPKPPAPPDHPELSPAF